MLRIATSLEAWLPTQPEYRMGYQKVIATLNSGSNESGFIINSQVFLKGDSFSPEILANRWEEVLREAAKSQFTVAKVRLIPREPETLRGVRQIAVANRSAVMANSAYGSERSRLLNESMSLQAKAASAAAEDAPITLTISGEIFVRYSAYANDRRITPGKGLHAGTFATTKADADANVRTGSDAVSRYALPNSAPASNKFTITPSKDKELQRGVAQPANGQPGGGIEVIFVKGLLDGTVSGPVTIPDK